MVLCIGMGTGTYGHVCRQAITREVCKGAPLCIWLAPKQQDSPLCGPHAQPIWKEVFCKPVIAERQSSVSETA
jgi:hypothetical protein